MKTKTIGDYILTLVVLILLGVGLHAEDELIRQAAGGSILAILVVDLLVDYFLVRRKVR